MTMRLMFHQLPKDAGQIVDVTYAVDWESHFLYQRRHDRSDGVVTIYRSELTGEGEFEPQNGVLPDVDDEGWGLISSTEGGE